MIADHVETLSESAPVWPHGDSREAVLRAGTDVLTTHGWIRGLPLLTHTSLARAAHCAPSTVYRHWATKQELVYAVVTRLAAAVDDRHGEAAQATLVGAVARGATVGEICRALAQSALDTHHADADVLIALQSEARFLDEDLLDLCRLRLERKRQPLTQLIGVFAAMYGIRPRSQESLGRAVRLAVSLSRGIASELWTADPAVLPVATLVDDFAEGMLAILAGQFELAGGGTFTDFADARPDPTMAEHLRRSLARG